MFMTPGLREEIFKPVLSSKTPGRHPPHHQNPQAHTSLTRASYHSVGRGPMQPLQCEAGRGLRSTVRGTETGPGSAAILSALVLPTPETGDTESARRAAAQSGWANGVGLSSRPPQAPPTAARMQGIPGPGQGGSILQRLSGP